MILTQVLLYINERVRAYTCGKTVINYTDNEGVNIFVIHRIYFFICEKFTFFKNSLRNY